VEKYESSFAAVQAASVEAFSIASLMGGIASDCQILHPGVSLPSAVPDPFMTNPFQLQPRIFVVDDEMDIAKMLSVVLQMNLFDAVPHSDPRAALEAAKAYPPDYLISDILMPEMNGVELAISIQQAIPACKVLLFSGHADAASLLENAKARGHSFGLVQKPIHPTELVAILREL
jgi:CheY-like chemotaxis protein